MKIFTCYPNNTLGSKALWRTISQSLSVLFILLVLTACSQSATSKSGTISSDKLNAPLPKAISAELLASATLIVDVIIDGDTENPLRVKNLVVDTDTNTYLGREY
ncbi:MAG: hypothetical protein COB30_016630 [Ectothiorhodospiraceae bacterium]|nr:hypothetical protein [Ectothiorhodospiraceae bacterium]